MRERERGGEERERYNKPHVERFIELPADGGGQTGRESMRLRE